MLIRIFEASVTFKNSKLYLRIFIRVKTKLCKFVLKRCLTNTVYSTLLLFTYEFINTVNYKNNQPE